MEAESASTAGGGPHSAAADALPYHTQGRRFDTTGPVYKDPAVVELLSTKYADKTKEAVGRDRAKTMQDLNGIDDQRACIRQGIFRTI